MIPQNLRLIFTCIFTLSFAIFALLSLAVPSTIKQIKDIVDAHLLVFLDLTLHLFSREGKVGLLYPKCIGPAEGKVLALKLGHFLGEFCLKRIFDLFLQILHLAIEGLPNLVHHKFHTSHRLRFSDSQHLLQF